RRLAGVERGLQALAEGDGLLLQRVAALGGAAGAIEALLHRVEILEDELGLDGGDVRRGIDAVVDVDDVLVLEAADDVRDGVRLADVAEEGVAAALALARAADEAGDVDELHRGRDLAER